MSLDGNEPKRPSPGRIGVWIVVSAIGVYLVASGVIGILSAGG